MKTRNFLRAILLTLFLSLALTSTAQESVPFGFTPAAQMTVEVLNTYPHDPTAFTQGLLWHEGSLYESTGLRGESSLREVDLTTGEVLRQIPVLRPADDSRQEYFAEGLELVNGRLLQLTWQAGEAFYYDLETFERQETISYEGEGWGICTDQRFIYMSDSTQFLAVRDMDSFDLIARMLVTVNGRPIASGLLNELECVGDHVYANLWQTDLIVQIDKTNGNVTQVIDAAGLLDEEMIREIPNFIEGGGRVMPPIGGVLNGIAYNPETETFYITGKLWSRLFEVRFVPQEG